MNDENVPAPKISTAEGIVVLFLLLILDTIEVLILFVGLDDFGITDLLGAPIFLYLNMKGIPPARQLIAWLVEIFPYLGWLPLKTTGWILTWWADAHPKSIASKAFSAAAAVTDVKKGGTQAAEKTGAGLTREAAEVGKTATQEAAEGAATTRLSEAELASKKAKEATEVFGGETATPTEKVQEELLGEKPVVQEAEKPQEESGKEATSRIAPKKEMAGEVEEAPEGAEGAGGEKEEEDEEKELVGSRLGGAYAEEEAIQKTMEEVEVEGNSVNLREKNSGIAGAENRFTRKNPPAAEDSRERLAA